MPNDPKLHETNERQVRYVYYIAGRVKVHPPVISQGQANVGSGPYTAPFEVVVRLPHPITHDDEREVVHEYVTEAVRAELQAAPGSQHHLPGDVVMHNVSHLHTILVDANDPEGKPARVLS